MKGFSFFFSENKFKLFVILFAVIFGILVRFPYLTSKDDFPFGDGGLFVEMIYAIKNNNYLLPNFVYYNGYQIPFAYPPLGFYFALLIAKVFSISILQSVQILPVIINLFTIAAFVLLASEITKDKIELFLSSGLFAIVLQTYLWTARGGGLSRSPGFLFAILTLYLFLLHQKRPADLVQMDNFYQKTYGTVSERIYLILSALAFALTTLSHIEWSLNSAASLLVLIFFSGKYKTKKDIYNLLIFSIVSALTTLPWWGLVIYRFGTAPFVNAWNVSEMGANQFFGKLFTGAIFQATIFSSQNYFLPVLGLLGFIATLFLKDRVILPIWLLTTYIASPKNSPISSILPLLFLITVGLRTCDRFLFQVFTKAKFPTKILPNISILYLFIIMSLSIPKLFNKPILPMLLPVQRTAMQFVKENTPREAKFIILTPNDWYSADAAEWFPYLAQRQSLTTPQGLEWISAKHFNQIVEQVTALSQMVRNEQNGIEPGLLADYVESNFTDYDYIAIFANDIESGFGGFLATDNYEIFYRKSDVLILRRLK